MSRKAVRGKRAAGYSSRKLQTQQDTIEVPVDIAIKSSYTSRCPEQPFAERESCGNLQRGVRRGVYSEEEGEEDWDNRFIL